MTLHQGQIVAAVLLGAAGACFTLFAPQIQESNVRMFQRMGLRGAAWVRQSPLSLRLGGIGVLLLAVYLLIKRV